MKENKTNTTDYLKRLEGVITNDDNIFIKVQTSEESHYSDYILNYNRLLNFGNLKKLFKGRDYKFYTLYDLNPFKIHPNTYAKIKKLDDEFVICYMIFENGVSQKMWREAELDITKALLDSSGMSWSSSYRSLKTNMYFEMVDFCVGAFKVYPGNRHIEQKSRTFSYIDDYDWGAINATTT